MLTLNQVGIIKQTVDERISAATRALVALHGMRNADLADVLGIGQNSVFMKLRGDSPWKAAEVAPVAEYFGVPISIIFDGMAAVNNEEAPALPSGDFRVVRHQGLEPRTH